LFHCQIGQNVRIVRTHMKGNTGTVLEVRALESGAISYQVGGQVSEHPEEVWNADLRGDALEAV
jgi:hypothetical protein